MPEGPEIRIMSDYINQVTSDRHFVDAFHVEKGNKPVVVDGNYLPSKPYKIKSDFYGKKIIIKLFDDDNEIPIYIFMGMSGMWKLVDTDKWSENKFTRLRFDSSDGQSLLLIGGYLGPKYSFFNNFKGSKEGYDIIKDYELFHKHIMSSINHKHFEKPIYELLLDQKYFAGIGNYLRSTIIYYADVNPFLSAREIISNNNTFLPICKEILELAYQKNGGQLKDWSNPFQSESTDFEDWVYYKKGDKIVDSNSRVFWYNPKWKA